MNYNKVKTHTVLQEILHLLRWFFFRIIPIVLQKNALYLEFSCNL